MGTLYPAWAQSIADEVAKLVRSAAVRERFHEQIRKWALGFTAGWTDQDLEEFGLHGRRRGRWQHLADRPPRLTELIPIPARPMTLPEGYSILATIHNRCIDGVPINPWHVEAKYELPVIINEKKYKSPPVITGRGLPPAPPTIYHAVRDTPEEERAYNVFSWGLACDVAEGDDWYVPDSSRAAIEKMLQDVLDDLQKNVTRNSGGGADGRVNTESEPREKKTEKVRLMRGHHRACVKAFEAQRKTGKRTPFKRFLKDWISHHEADFKEEYPKGLPLAEMYANIRQNHPELFRKKRRK